MSSKRHQKRRTEEKDVERELNRNRSGLNIGARYLATRFPRDIHNNIMIRILADKEFVQTLGYRLKCPYCNTPMERSVKGCILTYSISCNCFNKKDYLFRTRVCLGCGKYSNCLIPGKTHCRNCSTIYPPRAKQQGCW